MDGWPGGQGGRVAGWSGYGRVTGGQGKVAGFDLSTIYLLDISIYYISIDVYMYTYMCIHPAYTCLCV